MAGNRIARLREWYVSAQPTYEKLARISSSIIENLIQKEGIPFLSVSCRAKSLQSLLEKQRRKKYRDPKNEITDFAGVRVITYIESDIQRVSAIVRKSLHVDEARSVDKTRQLDIDQLGYRSEHFICGLGDNRTNLPEFDLFRNFFFELQVRTVLQHAWAEIEHDRNYKFSIELPQALKRRLFLIAGVLEVADRDFNSLSADIDAYADKVLKETRRGHLDIEISTPALVAYAPQIEKRFHNAQWRESKDLSDYDLIADEVKSFGIASLAQLDKIMAPDIVSEQDVKGNKVYFLGLIRDALILEDMNRYFEKAWKEHWRDWGGEPLQVIINKYGAETISKELKRLRISWGGSSWEDELETDEEN